MSYRDDHQAALTRIDALEHEHRLLAADNARLASELGQAQEWLGAPRKRSLALAGVIALVAIVGAAMFVCGRLTAPRAAAAAAAPPKQQPLPSVTGVMVGDGVLVGDGPAGGEWMVVTDDRLTDEWMLVATRCVPRGDGVQLTAAGSEAHSVWIGRDGVELELPARTIKLEPKKSCQVASTLTRTNDGADGFVQIACNFDGNRVHGRIDFKHCR